MNGKDLWRKYCGFFEKSFSQQLEYNENQLLEYFERWKGTKIGKLLCKDKVPASIDDVPLTEYSDYFILNEFKRMIEEKEKREPRKEGEQFYHYYMRIFREISNIVTDYMLDRPYFCTKTTGTTGTSKWVVHGERFWNNQTADNIALILMSCCKTWGECPIHHKPNFLNLLAPIPYISGWFIKSLERFLNLVPPIDVTDNIVDMRRKFYIALKMIEKGNKIDLAGGSGAMIYMICKYFSDRNFFLWESYKSTPNILIKPLILLKLLQNKLLAENYKDVKEIMPLKGVIVGSTDARIYAEFFKEEFNIEPLNAYGSTEVGAVMFGRPDRKFDFFPNLKHTYHEFLDKNGEIKKIYELKKEKVYELVVTRFDTMFIRYKTGDLLRVIDFYDEMPIFSFEGRIQTVLDIYNYFTVTENIMTRALVNAGFKASDRWAVTKILKPKEHLHILLEKEWNVSEREAEKMIFNSLLSILPDFQNYVREFAIKDPSDIIKVEFLKRGAFTRYAIKQARKNAPLGQYKPPKLITLDKYEVFEELKECGQ